MENTIVNKLCAFSFGILLVIILAISMESLAKKQTNKPIILEYDEFDSLCIKDNIPRNLVGEWNVQEIYDEKNNRQINIFSYTKQDSITYVVELMDEGRFKLTKTLMK